MFVKNYTPSPLVVGQKPFFIAPLFHPRDQDFINALPVFINYF